MVIKFESCRRNCFKYRFSIIKFCQTWLICYQNLCKPKLLLSKFFKIKQIFLTNRAKIIKTDYFYTLSYDNVNSSSILKSNKVRIKQFTQLKEQILDCFGCVDFALKNDLCDYNFYDKQHKIFSPVDFVFMNFETDSDSMQSTQISICDQLLLHIFLKPSN